MRNTGGFRWASMAWIATLLISTCAWATEYHGQVFVGTIPVPGAAVTVIQEGQQFSTVTDEQGLYAFPISPMEPGRSKFGCAVSRR